MSETGSEWAPPAESQPKSARELLEARYADRANPDDMDNMVVLPGEQAGMIEVPDWNAAPEDGTETEVVVDGPFSVGREITVLRSAKDGVPAYEDTGWKIINSESRVRNRETGQVKPAVIVEKIIDGKSYTKRVSTEEVLELNNKEAEPQPLSDAEEDVAELAIEVSTGIEDPSEVDENARMFDPAELRAMREASQRAAHLEAPKVNPYDALLDPNTPDVVEKETRPDVYAYLKEALPPVTRGETEASRKYYDKFVTEENKQVSLEFLGEAVKADREIARILSEAGLKPTDMAAVDAIRENPDVRYNVAKRLTQKLDTLADQNPEDFGWRVADNSPNNLKVDPQTGKRMMSRMYAVDMALKMLGGEFSERNEAKDFERDSNGRVAIGQHRSAATTTIMSRYA